MKIHSSRRLLQVTRHVTFLKWISQPTGLYGSIKEDYCALLAFSIILSLVIAFEICLGVSAFALAQENRLTSAVAEKLEQSLDNYGRAGHAGVTKSKENSLGQLRRCSPVDHALIYVKLI